MGTGSWFCLHGARTLKEQKPDRIAGPDAVTSRVRAYGWRQGHTLADTGYGVVARDSDSAKTIWRHYEPDERRRIVVTSQSCDIVKPISSEPYVNGIPAYVSTDKSVLHNANRNSARYFLLDPKTGLIADASVSITVDKAVLAEVSPAVGIADDPQRKAWFSRWLGRRLTRPAIDDPVVHAVVGPLARVIRKAEKSALGAAALAWVNEVRIRHLETASFYAVDLLFICDDPVPATEKIELAKIAAQFRKELDSSKAQLRSFEIVSLLEISYGDVLQTDEIPLDELTYLGEESGGTPR